MATREEVRDVLLEVLDEVALSLRGVASSRPIAPERFLLEHVYEAMIGVTRRDAQAEALEAESADDLMVSHEVGSHVRLQVADDASAVSIEMQDSVRVVRLRNRGTPGRFDGARAHSSGNDDLVIRIPSAEDCGDEDC